MSVVIEILRVLASLMNIIMFLSPIPTMREIHRTKSTGHMPFVPLAAMVSNAYIWMMYGYLADNIVAIFASCAFGVAVSLIYVAIYYRWTTERGYARKVMALFALVMISLTTYIILGVHGSTGQTYDQVRLVIGYISITSSVVMYTSPFEKIRLVVHHKSAVFIPIHIVAVGSVNSATWVLFSFLTNDWMVFAPNLFLLVIGLVQIALYWVYRPSKHPLVVGGGLDPMAGTAIDDAAAKDLEASIAISQSVHHTDDKENTSGDPSYFVPLRSPLAPLQHQN